MPKQSRLVCERVSVYDAIADMRPTRHARTVTIRKLDSFKEALANLKAVRPPASLQAVRRLADIDFASAYVQERRLVLDLVLRISADSIVSCYDFREPERAKYLEALRAVFGNLHLLRSNQTADTELSSYLDKLDFYLAEFSD